MTGATIERATPEATERYVKAEDVAAILNLRPSTIREFARRQHDPIPSVKLGRARRFKVSAAVEWAERQGG